MVSRGAMTVTTIVTSAISETSVPIGSSTDVSVTLTNDSASDSGAASLTASPPAGWSIEGDSTATVDGLAPGASRTTTFVFRNDSAVGTRTLEVNLERGGLVEPVRFDVNGTCAGDGVPLTSVGADSEETVGENAPASMAVDGNPATFWHTQWKASQAAYPHFITVDASSSAARCGLDYLARQDANVRRVKDYEVYVSDDATTFPTTPAAKGTLADVATAQTIPLGGATGRYVKLVGLNAWDGKPFMVAAELSLR